MKSIKKYLDWQGWIKGFYLTWIKTVTTTLLALIGTHGAESTGLSMFKDVGISFTQAGGIFLTITIVEVLKYLQAKPLPDTVTVEVGTTITTKPK